MQEHDVPAYRGLRTPRAAGIAGVIFSVLFGVSLVLLRTVLGPDPSVPIDWNGPAGARVRVAMVFVSMSIAGGLLATARADLAVDAEHGLSAFGRAVMLQISNVYALRTAGVFMLSLGTVWFRTGLMPRWLVATTFLLALAMLVIATMSLWVTLLFPAWVLTVSTYVLIRPGSAGDG